MILFLLIIAFILVGSGLTWFLLSHDKGHKEPVGILWLAAGFGVVGAVAAAYAETKLIPLKYALPVEGTPLFPILLAMLTVGFIEEFCKFVPLAIFLYKRRYFNEVTDGIIYFAIAGLGFGIPENILYTLNYGVKTGLYRIILTPIFHAATTGMVGYFYAKSKVEKRSLLIPAIALVSAMLLHGFYDFGLSSGVEILSILSIMITLGTSSCLFIFFLRAREIDTALGLNIVTTSRFCEHCGFPNPKADKYCTHCGQHVLISTS